jgi:hypothetical protein
LININNFNILRRFHRGQEGFGAGILTFR